MKYSYSGWLGTQALTPNICLSVRPSVCLSVTVFGNAYSYVLVPRGQPDRRSEKRALSVTLSFGLSFCTVVHVFVVLVGYCCSGNKVMSIFLLASWCDRSIDLSDDCFGLIYRLTARFPKAPHRRMSFAHRDGLHSSVSLLRCTFFFLFWGAPFLFQRMSYQVYVCVPWFTFFGVFSSLFGVV